MQEWLTLATAGECSTTDNPVMSTHLTPALYTDMIFVGLSDNTRLESYVSLYKTFAHVNMTGASVENHFRYHAGLEAERMQLHSPEMR